MESYEVALDSDEDLSLVQNWARVHLARMERIAPKIVNVSFDGELEDDFVEFCEMHDIPCRLL